MNAMDFSGNGFRTESMMNIDILLRGLNSWGVSDDEASQMLKIPEGILLNWRRNKDESKSSILVPVSLEEDRLRDINASMLISCAGSINQKIAEKLSINLPSNSDPIDVVKTLNLKGIPLYDHFMSGSCSRTSKARQMLSNLFDI